MKGLKKIFGAWNLSKELPKLLVCVGLGAALMLPLVCGKRTNVIHTTEYHDSTITITDSTVIVKFKPIYVDRFHTVIVDSNHDCWDAGVILPFGLDTVTIDSVNSCKGEYVGATLSRGEFVHELEEPPPTEADSLPPFVPSFGFRLDAILGPSLPGGTVIGVHGQAWLGRVSIFAYPRLVIPDFSRSSVDVGVGYRLF